MSFGKIKTILVDGVKVNVADAPEKKPVKKAEIKKPQRKRIIK